MRRSSPSFDIPENARGGALTIGNFDGVHAGHRKIIQTLRQVASMVGGPAVAITFDPPPAQLLRPEIAPKPLTTIAWKKELLLAAGVDHVIVLPTSFDLLKLEATQFFDLVIRELCAAKGVVEGENFRFGRDRTGDTALLGDLCSKNEMIFQIADAALCDGEWISSTRIRRLITDGEIDHANRFLIRPYRLCGSVETGAKRGSSLGFPTANLHSIPVLVPANGVYAAKILGISGRSLPDDDPTGHAVALHIGPNPTFAEYAQKVEAHILDFCADLYGSILEIEIISRVRNVYRFDSMTDLLKQLHIDIETVRKIVSSKSSSNP